MQPKITKLTLPPSGWSCRCASDGRDGGEQRDEAHSEAVWKESGECKVKLSAIN